MICYEIWLNEKKLFLVGHKDALALEATVSFHRENLEQFLNVVSVVWREGMEAKDCFWEAPRLGVGDQVRVKLVDSEAPSEPNYELPYGMRTPPPWGSEDARCSFCGAPKNDRKLLFEGPSVKICDACVAFYHRMVSKENASET